MSQTEMAKIYADFNRHGHQRSTDLNTECEKEILSYLQNKKTSKILEVGCGNGTFAGLISEFSDVTAVDFQIHPAVREKFPKVEFSEQNILSLSFPDKSFDTVLCAHTLEHVVDLAKAIRELRRVAKNSLIIVLPRERPYKYTFNLHLHFFPYEFSVRAALGPPDRHAHLKLLGGDWLYIEENQ